MTVVVAVLPTASETNTLNVPTPKLALKGPLAPLLQLYEKGVVPLLALAKA